MGGSYGLRIAGFAAAWTRLMACSLRTQRARRRPRRPAPVPRSTPDAAPVAPMVSTDGIVCTGPGGTQKRRGDSGRDLAQRVVASARLSPGPQASRGRRDIRSFRGGRGSLELSRFEAGGSAKLTAALPAEAEQKIEAAVLRNILKPVMANNRIGGYVLKPGESLPQLVRAGLRPGDVIMSVNGSQLDEERMSELAWQMGNAAKTEFVFMRSGKKMRAIL